MELLDVRATGVGKHTILAARSLKKVTPHWSSCRTFTIISFLTYPHLTLIFFLLHL
jgi:hypothetical protein